MASTPAADLTRVSAHVTGAEPPANAPREVSQPLMPSAGGIAVAVNPRTGESYAREDWHSMGPAERARHNARELAPLVATGPKQGGIAEAVEAVAEGKLDPFYANLKQRVPAAPGPPRSTPLTRMVDHTFQPPAAAAPLQPPPQGSKSRWHRVSRAPR